MPNLVARVFSVHAGSEEDKTKPDRRSIRFELDGIVGDKHRSFSRNAWAGDKQAQGTLRRNERQWSAVSLEELREISEAMELRLPITASNLGANLCLEGVEQLSKLPKGTLLRFPSGAELCVEEYNPPCHDMGKRLAASRADQNGDSLATTAFSNAARLTRGLVGVVEVPGDVHPGDEVIIVPYEHPPWLQRAED
ncbi:MAG: MOSC domain-containing protein [Woeseiaceae bacterium]